MASVCYTGRQSLIIALATMFPKWNHEVLRDSLERFDWRPHETMTFLMMHRTKKALMQELYGTPAKPFAASDLSTMKVCELKAHLKSRCLSCSGKKAELVERLLVLGSVLDGGTGQHPSSHGGARGSEDPLVMNVPSSLPIFPTIPTQSTIVRIREGRHAQSLLCMPSVASAEEYITKSATSDPHALTCFQAMIDREQQHWDYYVVFYHSYNHAAVLYEVQSIVAQAIYGLPADSAPLPRLLQGCFRARPSLDMLKEDYKEMYNRDANWAFRAVAISVSCSIFGIGSEAPPLHFFQGGYSCEAPFRKLLKGILQAFGLEHQPGPNGIAAVSEKIALVAARYGLGIGFYGSHSGAVGLRKAALAAPKTGHMLQIFIRTDEVDRIAYRSLPWGRPVRDQTPISAFLRGFTGHPMGPVADAPGSGQARLLADPRLLTDPRRCIVYHYSASLGYMAADPTAPGSRGAFREELRQVLAAVIGTADGRARARQGVEAAQQSDSA